jgi:propionate CoA-transferase
MLTVESGAIGGTPAGGMSFGATSYPEAVIKQAELFDFYDGGGIDIVFLGFGQIDKNGRINVASLGSKLNGVGGFINISQAAKRLIFCGSFTASGLQVMSDEGESFSIKKEGRIHKLVERVERICYDPAGRTRCRDPLVITERAVMKLSSDGLEVIEIAPGIDLQRDILDRSEFPLKVSSQLKTMPLSIFGNGEVLSPFVT